MLYLDMKISVLGDFNKDNVTIARVWQIVKVHRSPIKYIRYYGCITKCFTFQILTLEEVHRLLALSLLASL